MKVHIATSRPIGMKCALWYSNSAPIWRGYTEKVKLADVVVSVLYDQLFTEEFIKSKKAVYNFHPGILPEYRGAGLYSWAIINGEKEFGITLHKIMTQQKRLKRKGTKYCSQCLSTGYTT